jgi:catechol 2,3-dioxygenase-like lactoylglutathione lyase family enzyme
VGVTGIPILPSRDLDATAAFYAALGFNAAGRWPGYLILTHGTGIELHFWEHPDEDPLTNDVACYFRFDSGHMVRALHAAWVHDAELPGHGVPRLVAPQPTDYGLLEMALVDADGSLVRVGGPLT